MRNKLAFWSGILGIVLFSAAAVLGGFQFENYNIISQYISETYAIGTPYGKALRFFGYIPSGFFLAIFGFTASAIFSKSTLAKIGYLGIGIFYGIATVIVGIFPCDEGCNREFTDPSLSQIIHNLISMLTYMFVPISIILVGTGLRHSEKFKGLSVTSFIFGLISIAFIGLLISDLFPTYLGLYQRIIEGTFILWIIVCSIYIRSTNEFDLSTLFSK